MSDADDLGEFIDEEKPYGTDYGELDLDNDFKSASQQWDGRPNNGQTWTFPGSSTPQNPVRKALRIKYTYTRENGETRVQYLLVGYEGAGSDD